MKTIKENAAVNSTYVVNEKMLDQKHALKYIGKPAMLAEILDIQVALAKLNAKYTPRQYDEKNSKQELFEGYSRLAIIYKELSAKQAAEIEKNTKTLIKTADVLAKEAKERAEQVAKEEAEKAARKAKKAAKADKGEAKEPKAPKNEPKPEKTGGSRGTAQERLDKYTAELAEKEAIKEPSKDVKKRIASLKRKIERAKRALAA